jgi:hypothetical protein
MMMMMMMMMMITLLVVVVVVVDVDVIIIVIIDHRSAIHSQYTHTVKTFTKLTSSCDNDNEREQ